MKQTTQKKPKTFRTLIRRIHISHKAAVEENNESAVRKKNEKQSPFFFGQ